MRFARRKGITMKSVALGKIAVLAMAPVLLLGGCATDMGKGALIGGVAGAGVSAATGHDAVKGAVVGAVAGAVIGYVVEQGKKRELYSDANGNRYWVDDNGQRQYTN